MELIIKISNEMFDTFKKHGIMTFDNLDEYNKDILADIIANGTPYNPKDDLISRSDLKTQLEVYRHTRNYKSDEDEAQNDLLDNILEDIDNAQAIPLPNEQIAWEQGYEAGLAQGKHDRPQGVWTTDEKGYFYCDKCGKYPHDQYSMTNFCPTCGADMRGDNK